MLPTVKTTSYRMHKSIPLNTVYIFFRNPNLYQAIIVSLTGVFFLVMPFNSNAHTFLVLFDGFNPAALVHLTFIPRGGGGGLGRIIITSDLCVVEIITGGGSLLFVTECTNSILSQRGRAS